MMRLLLLLVLLVAAACAVESPFERANPYDPQSQYPLRLVGVPDTVDAIGEEFTVVIARDYPLPDRPLRVEWYVLDTARRAPQPPPPTPWPPAPFSEELLPTGNGGFQATPILTARFVSNVLYAKLNNSVVLTRPVVVGQRVRAMSLSCRTVVDSTPCDAGVATGALQVSVTARDGGGSLVQGLEHAMARATAVSRDAAVAIPMVMPNAWGHFRFAATGAGSTWLVIRMDFVTDSVRVVVAP